MFNGKRREEMQQGYVKLYRKIIHNPIFNNHQLYRLWSLCLLNASYKEREILIDNQLVKVKPGQWVVGRFSLYDAYNNGLSPKDRVKSEKTPYRWLEKLEEMGYVTLQKTNRFTIINVVNWAFYQGDDGQNDQQNDPHFDQQMTIKSDDSPSNFDHQNDQQNDQQKTNDIKGLSVKNENHVRKNDHQTDQQMTNRSEKFVHKQECIKKDKNNNMRILEERKKLFDHWWNFYGKKLDRKKCETKFLKILEKHSFDEIMEGTQRYLDYLKATNTDKQYQKYPYTFLNGENWKDEYEIPTTTSSNRTPFTQQEQTPNYKQLTIDPNKGEF